MPYFRPTLIIGLGTTGLKVIESFQQLLLEEYGPNSLPCLQMLVFETVAGTRSRNNIKVVPIGIEDGHRVQEQYKNPDPDNKDKVKGYKEWLDESVIATRGDGAGGDRQVGRLILWENWDVVTQEIQAAYERCNNQSNKDVTVQVLRAHYTQNNINYDNANILAPEPPRIFVVGTLCGGSCSGMATDIGFFLSNRFDLERSSPTLIASILTSPCAEDARFTMAACNNFGALKELDFWYQPLPLDAWSFTLPDRTISSPMVPYKNVYLVSGSNGDTSLQEYQLNQMIAMNLFLNICGQSDREIDAALADFKDHATTPRRNNAGYVQRLLSFGISAVWYPKSNITGLSACALSKELCMNWLLSQDEVGPIRTQADKCFEELVVGLKTNLRQKVSVTLEEIKKERSSVERNISTSINKFLDAKLQKIRTSMIATDENLRDDISFLEDEIEILMNRKLYKDYKNTARMGVFIAQFKMKIEEYLKRDYTIEIFDKCFSEKPESFGKRNHTIKKVMNNIWLKSVFKKKQAILFHRRKLMDEIIVWMENILIDYVEKRMYVILCIISDQEKTKIKELFKKNISHSRGTLLNSENEVVNLKLKIESILAKIDQKKIENFSNLENMAVLHTVSRRGDIRIEVEENKAEILRNNSNPGALSVEWHLVETRNPRNIRKVEKFWIEPNTEDIADMMINNYQKSGLAYIAQDILVDAENERLLQLANFSKPYQLLRNFTRIQHHRPYGFIFGSNTNRLMQIAQSLTSFGGQPDQRIKQTHLKHILFIYREERYFAVDHLEAFEGLKRQSRGRRHLTSKDARFFDWRKFENTEKAETLLTVSMLLLKERILIKTGDRYAYRCKNERSENIYYYTDDKENFEELGQNEEHLDQLEDKVKNTLRVIQLGPYLELYNKIRDDLENEKNIAEVDKNRKIAIEKVLKNLKRFHAETVVKVFPELDESAGS